MTIRMACANCSTDIVPFHLHIDATGHLSCSLVNHRYHLLANSQPAPRFSLCLPYTAPSYVPSSRYVVLTKCKNRVPACSYCIGHWSDRPSCSTDRRRNPYKSVQGGAGTPVPP